MNSTLHKLYKAVVMVVTNAAYNMDLYKAVVMEVANAAYNMDLHRPASILPPETTPNES